MLDIENRLASKTVPRNVKDFPTLWNKIKLMFVLAAMIIRVMFTRTMVNDHGDQDFGKIMIILFKTRANDDHAVEDSGTKKRLFLASRCICKSWFMQSLAFSIFYYWFLIIKVFNVSTRFPFFFGLVVHYRNLWNRRWEGAFCAEYLVRKNGRG